MKLQDIAAELGATRDHISHSLWTLPSGLIVSAGQLVNIYSGIFGEDDMTRKISGFVHTRGKLMIGGRYLPLAFDNSYSATISEDTNTAVYYTPPNASKNAVFKFEPGSDDIELSFAPSFARLNHSATISGFTSQILTEGDKPINLTITNASADDISGGPGDDTFQLGYGDDKLDGGGGTDMLKFPRPHSEYDIRLSDEPGWVEFEHPTEGTKLIRNVETVLFSDGKTWPPVSTPTPAPAPTPVPVDPVPNPVPPAPSTLRDQLIGVRDQLSRIITTL